NQNTQNNTENTNFTPPSNYVDVQPTVTYENQNPDAPETVSGIDPGANMFVAISPTTPTDLSTSGSGETLLVVSNPAPVQPAHNAEPQAPHVTQGVGPHLNQLLSPTVPSGGVPGIEFNYSASGNSALW
ncbi:MAG TPA: hypothetical protein VH020_12670, partial [Stellaceae bacterium]|nr:hypothetical protein [Stellaceae bacterium]